MADTQPDRTIQPATRDTATARGGTLTCQWCSVTLPAGETVCPTCGSSAVPDESMIVPGGDDPLSISEVAVDDLGGEELVEWWNEPAEVERQTYRNSARQADDPLPVIAMLVGAGLFCVVAGVIGVPFLAPVIEENIGIVIENPADLRPIGAILGLLVGLFIGTIGMWISAPGK